VSCALGLLLLAGCGTTGGSSPGGITSGIVTAALSKQQYATGDTISVTLGNGLASTILAADHQSDCTVVVVEYLSQQTWQPRNLCQLKSPTRFVPVNAGATLTQQVHPPTAGGTTGWPSGTYRIAFTYRLSASGTDTTIYSAQFTIS